MPRSLTLAFWILLMLANRCHAWSEAGHIIIAELAYKKLPVEVQRILDEQAAILLAASPEKRDYWLDRYPGYSRFAYSAAWPDAVRDLSVEELFQRYRAAVPPALDKYRSATSDNWHYTNRWYFNGSGVGIPMHCKNALGRLGNRGELLPAIERLYAGYGNTESPAARAVILAMLIHLLSDLHQPLHNFGKVGGDCQHDRGGGGFCLVRAGTQCEMSLHRWWDDGAGLFDTSLNIGELKKGFIVRNSDNLLSDPVASHSIGDLLLAWSDESHRYTTRVYALAEGSPPDKDYVISAKTIVKTQAARAVERLRQVLHSLSD